MVFGMTAITGMNRNKVVLVSALTAATLGVAGLAAIALPAGAGEQPSLPEISAEELVSSALAAQPPAMNGTIGVDNALGLPAVPGLPTQLMNGNSEIRVWYDGDDRSRVALHGRTGEQTMVDDGTTLWKWDSATRDVTKITRPAEDREHAETFDPAAMAGQLLAVVRPTSTIAVDGTAMVADRPAYELVLSPAPTERTLLREVRVAIDSQTRIPLQLEVLANGTNEPVFSIGFQQLTVGPQDPSLFQFSPPPGANVIEPDVGPASKRPDAGGPLNEVAPTMVGDGWDTVIVATLPEGMLTGNHGNAGSDSHGRGMDPKALLERIGTPVNGPWGSGRLISTAVVSVIITDDGRVAAGAVPQQVLVEALSR
jgi:outer membrane lipoprotein-sorting protein